MEAGSEKSIIREVIEIFHTENKVSKVGRKYKITHVLMDDGMEAEYFGNDVKQGDLLEVFFDNQHGKVKARKTPTQS